MVSGSVASARHGEARATQDIDLVIDPSPEQIAPLTALLVATGWYVGDVEAAFSGRDPFNVIDTTSGWKVHLIIRKNRPLSESEFGRRQPARFGAVDTWIVTVEDSILSKLEWASDSGSERQLRNIRSMIRQQRTTIDWVHLREWADRLSVRPLLEEVVRSDSGQDRRT
jgi:hypothetical protein